uniref:Uncharacterized protein n=1 Tax=Arundo donax TaxID=35708 RepID=A0A0A9GPD0_ARUDO
MCYLPRDHHQFTIPCRPSTTRSLLTASGSDHEQSHHPWRSLKNRIARAHLTMCPPV